MTTHVETVVPALNAYVKTRLIAQGYRLAPNLETITKAELSQSLKQGIPVVWHAHRNHEMLWGLQLKLRYPNLRLVFTRHTSGPPSLPTKLLMNQADACVVLNEDSLRHFKRGAQIVHHGIDGIRFPYRRDASGIRQAGFSLGTPTIGIVGRVRPEKGHDVLVNAALELRKDYPELKLVFIGACDTKHESWLRRLKQKAPGLIEWVGEQSEIESWYQGIDIIALPSFREGFSCMVLEAMSSGCTVAVSDISDFHQLIDHGNNGYLFDAGDHHALATILEHLLKNPATVQKVGKEASHTITQRFTAEHEARSLFQVYQPLLAI